MSMERVWIAAALVLAALWLLSLIRFGGQAAYGPHGLQVWLRVCGIMILLYPRKKVRTRRQQRKRPEKEQREPPAAKDVEPGERWELIKRLLPILLEAAGRLRRRIRVQPLNLTVWIPGAEDPAVSAIWYGRANAALGALWPALNNALDIRDSQVSVRADFTTEQLRLEARAGVSLTVGQALFLGLWTGGKVLFTTIQWKKKYSERRKAA